MSIASGSSGNATYVGNNDTHLLIDSGVSKKKITEGLKRLGLALSDLDAILITHEHSDHICSLNTIRKSEDLPVYCTAGTASEIVRKCSPDFNDNIQIIKSEKPFEIGSILIDPYDICHDASEPVCYRFKDNFSSCGIITDLGYYDQYLVNAFSECDAVIVESNHDIRMLEAGPYPYPLKRRIAGKYGHLSNEDAGKFISMLLNDHMKYVVLGHLSKKNNYADLAWITVRNCIEYSNSDYKAGDFHIEVASQEYGTDIYEF